MVKRYAATMNGIQLAGWSMVLLHACVSYRDSPTHLLLLCLVVQLLNVYDLLLIINRHLPGKKRVWLFQNAARVIFLLVLLLAEKYGIYFRLFQVLDAASLLLVTWSIAEISRFAFYLFRSNVFAWLRYNLFLLCYPAGAAVELMWMYIIFTGLPFLWIKIFLAFLATAYLFGFPFLFLHLYRSRRQKLKHE